MSVNSDNLKYASRTDFVDMYSGLPPRVDGEYSRSASNGLPDSSNGIDKSDVQLKPEVASERRTSITSNIADGDCSLEFGENTPHPEQPHHLDHSIDTDDFINSLMAAGGSDHSAISLSNHLVPGEDPHLVELNELITELEHLQDFDVQLLEPVHATAPEVSPSECHVTTPRMRSCALEQGTPAAVTETQNVPTSFGDQKMAKQLADDKVKSHPAMAALLMNGTSDADEPFKPLKEKPFRRSGGLEGSLLYLKNAEKKVVGFASSGPGLSVIEHDSDVHSLLGACDGKYSETMTKTVAGSEDIQLDNRLHVSSPSSVSEQTRGGQAIQSHHSLSRCGDDGENSFGETSPINLHYLRVLEEKLRMAIVQNQRLANVNVLLQADNAKLQEEVGYLKNLLSSQSSIARILHEVPQASAVQLRSQLDRLKRKTFMKPADDEPMERAKKFKGPDLKDGREPPPGGVCLHISRDSKVASIESCQYCVNVARCSTA